MEKDITTTGTPSYDTEPEKYEYVQHPSHYNDYDVEVIEMMKRIWGPRETAIWCKLTAFKYRMRMGHKPDESVERELAKEQFYLIRQKLYETEAENLVKIN